MLKYIIFLCIINTFQSGNSSTLGEFGYLLKKSSYYPLIGALRPMVRTSLYESLFSPIIQEKKMHTFSDHKSTYINVQDLDLSLNDKPVFNRLNFSMASGDNVTIVGPNGCGKSTFLNILRGKKQEFNSIIKINGSVGYLPQNFDHLSTTETAFEHIAKMLDLADLDNFMKEESDRFSKAWYQEFNERGGHGLLKNLSILGIQQKDLEKPFSQLSGGQKTKVYLAGLSHAWPDILLLDEPTNHLDEQGLRWLQKFLKSFDGAVLMVTHDRKLINDVSHRISELSPHTKNFIHFKGGYKGYLEEQEKMRQRALQERLRQEKELKNLLDKSEKISAASKGRGSHSNKKDGDKLGFNARGQRNEKSNSRVLNQIERKIDGVEKNIIDVPIARHKVEFKFSKHIDYNVNLTVDDLEKGFEGVKLFSNFSLSLGPGDRLIMQGDNGSGKTTMLKLLANFLRPDRGVIKVSSNAKIGYLDQEQETLDLSKTPLELLEDDPAIRRNNTDIIEALEKVGVFHRQDLFNSLDKLSIGCRRKVQLCQLLLQGTNLLLLDEPTNHIDFPSLEAIEDALLTFQGIIVAVSHDDYFIQKIATRTLNLRNYKP